MPSIVEELLNKEQPRDAKKTLKALGYVRVSTQMQVDKEFSSIAAQKILIKDFVVKNPSYILEKIFEEPGKSAKDNNRPALKELLERVKMGGVDVILAVRLDRVSRSNREFYNMLDILAKYGTRLVYTNDMTPDDTPAGRLMTGLRIGYSEFERTTTAYRQAQKYLVSLKEGLYPAGPVPFGYKRGDKYGILEIEENEAQYVREMYELCAAGKRPSEIAEHMVNNYGERPPKVYKSGRVSNPGLYNENFVRRILRNPFYAGYACLKVTGGDDLHPKYQVFEGKQESVVERKTWQRVQSKLNSMAKNLKRDLMRNCDRYLLKSLMWCSCGRQMTVTRSGKVHRDGSRYGYYTCTRKISFRQGSSCKSTIALGVIEGVVLVVLGKVFSEYASKRRTAEPTEYEFSLKEERKGLIQKKRRLDEKLSKMLALMCELTDNPTLKDRTKKGADKISEEVLEIEERIGYIEKELSVLSRGEHLDKAHIKSQICRVDLLKDELTFKEKKEVIEKCIEKLVLRLTDKKSQYRKEFLLTVVPTPDFFDPIGALEVKFTVDTSMGVSCWIITSPFKYECNFGHVREKNPEGVIKKQPMHFIHEIIRWKQMKDKMSVKEMMSILKVQRIIIYRKIKLLEILSDKVVSFLMDLRDETEIELMSFRFLCKVAETKKSEQLKMVKNKINDYKDLRE